MKSALFDCSGIINSILMFVVMENLQFFCLTDSYCCCIHLNLVILVHRLLSECSLYNMS